MEEILIKGEKIYLKKSNLFGWRVIYPLKEDGKINWYNFLFGGNIVNVIIIATIVFVLIGALQEYANAINVANECLQSKEVSQGFNLGRISLP